MKDVDRRLVELASQQHQVFSRAQASTLGLSASTLCRRLQAGTLVACGPHSLCFPGVTLTWRTRLHAGLLDLGPDALVSGHAAAALLQLDGFEEGRLEYLVPRSERRRTTIGWSRRRRKSRSSTGWSSAGCRAFRAPGAS